MRLVNSRSFRWPPAIDGSADRISAKGTTPSPSPTDTLKQRVVEGVDGHADEIVRISRQILSHPETGFKEVKTSALVTEVLRGMSLETRDGIAITGVRARLDGGMPGPNVVVLGELDSNLMPDHPLADPETGAAHACGHHCQIGGMLGVAFALQASGVMAELAGSVTFFAVPAEEYLELEWRLKLRDGGKIEYLGGKPELIRLGELDDADFCMLTHTTPDEPSFTIGKTNNGMLGKMIRFRGVAAHAGGAPHLGVNALNAAEVALAAIHAQRDTFKDEDLIRIHPIITRGGSVVNAVPHDVRMETYVRGSNVPAIMDANAKVDRSLRAGAMASGGSVEIATAPGYLPFQECAPLADLWTANAEKLVGRDEVGHGGHSGGSTDMGDLSHIIATIQPYASGATGRGHSENYMVEDYEKAVVNPAKAMAMTVVDLLANGAESGAKVLDAFVPEMTRESYLETMSALFTTKTYTE